MRYTGVLPYAYESSGDLYFLCGKERYSPGFTGSNLWSDFGGDPEGESVILGGAREFFEESMGMFGNVNQIAKKLKTATRVKVLEGVMFLFEVHYDKNLPMTFKNVYKYMNLAYPQSDYEHGYLEKTGVKWVSLRDLKNAVKERDYRYRKEFISSCKTMFKILDFE